MTSVAKSNEIFFDIASQDSCAAACDGPGDPWNFRIVDIASHRAEAPAGKARDRNLGPSEAWVVSRCENS